MPRAFADEAQLMASLCVKAGRLAVQIAQSPLVVEYKESDQKSPVTNADKAVNTLIVEALQRHFPADAICAEESPDSHAFASRQKARRLWCIDPIDGTREYIAGSGQWAVMVGLCVEGEARFGAIYEAHTDALYMGAVQDAHAPAQSPQRWAEQTQRGHTTPLHVSRVAQGAQSRLLVSRATRNKALDAIGSRLRLAKRIPLGSVGLKMARLAQGEAELYACLTDKIHEWDACGPAAVVQAAGGTVTSLNGEALRLNKPNTAMAGGLLASNGAMHAEALEAVQQAAAHAPAVAKLLGPSGR